MSLVASLHALIGLSCHLRNATQKKIASAFLVDFFVTTVNLLYTNSYTYWHHTFMVTTSAIDWIIWYLGANISQNLMFDVACLVYILLIPVCLEDYSQPLWQPSGLILALQPGDGTLCHSQRGWQPNTYLENKWIIMLVLTQHWDVVHHLSHIQFVKCVVRPHLW